MCHWDEDYIEHGCCPLRGKAWFLTFWTLIHAIVFLAFSCNHLFNFREIWGMNRLGIAFVLIFSLIHLFGGLCLLVGTWKVFGHPFMVGLILSSIGPYILFLSIYLPAVQIFFTITSCKYYKRTMHDTHWPRIKIHD